MTFTKPSCFHPILKEIRLEKPSDKIIQQIRGFIRSGQLNLADRIPSERKLGDIFVMPIRKLEIYGILKTMAQSGTVVADKGITALEGFITMMDGQHLHYNNMRYCFSTLEIGTLRRRVNS